MGIIKTFDISITPNHSVNTEKLNYELKTSPIASSVYAYTIGDKIIHIEFKNEDSVSPEESLILQQILSVHDGAEAEVTQHKVDDRELKIRGLVQMAFYHPLLDNDITTSYLTSIDNYINAFIRGGNYSSIVAKLSSDGMDTEGEFYNYLNQVVNTSGNKTFEFFIYKVMS